MCTLLLKKMAHFEQRANEEKANEWLKENRGKGEEKKLATMIVLLWCTTPLTI